MITINGLTSPLGKNTIFLIMSGGMNGFYGLALGGFMEKIRLWLLFGLSLLFFGLGLSYPIIKSEILLGLTNDYNYLISSIGYFYQEGDYFIGTLILLFSLLLPLCKYLLIGLGIAGWGRSLLGGLYPYLELLGKWAMLDVFVVALVIVNMKFDSLIIKTQIASGTVYFAISILLLSVCASLLDKKLKRDAAPKADY